LPRLAHVDVVLAVAVVVTVVVDAVSHNTHNGSSCASWL